MHFLPPGITRVLQRLDQYSWWYILSVLMFFIGVYYVDIFIWCLIEDFLDKIDVICYKFTLIHELLNLLVLTFISSLNLKIRSYFS